MIILLGPSQVVLTYEKRYSPNRLIFCTVRVILLNKNSSKFEGCILNIERDRASQSWKIQPLN